MVCKLFPKPQISDVLMKLYVFQRATALNFNIGFYTIRFDPAASIICTIILPWSKYSYKRLLLGIAGPSNIFQAKMTNLNRLSSAYKYTHIYYYLLKTHLITTQRRSNQFWHRSRCQRDISVWIQLSTQSINLLVIALSLYSTTMA